MGGNKISASGVSEEGKKERRNKKKEVKGKDVKMARREKRIGWEYGLHAA